MVANARMIELNLSGLFTPSEHLAMPEISCVTLAPQAFQDLNIVVFR